MGVGSAGVGGQGVSLIGSGVRVRSGVTDLLVPQPSLHLDFLNRSALQSSITFTRASTGYYTTSAGVLVPFASGAPRIGDRGFLVEGARTNLLLRSQEFDNAAWLKENNGDGLAPVVTANAGLAPDGTMTADRVQLDLGGGATSDDYCQLRQSVAGAANPHDETASVWVKSFDGASYDIGIGRSLLVAQRDIFTITGEWQRIDRATLAIASTSYMVSIGLRGDQGTSDTADLLFWGAQLEAASFMDSPIITAGSTVTRAADVATITGLDTAGWFNDGGPGTLIIDYGDEVLATGGNAVVWSISDASVNNAVNLFKDASGNRQVRVVSGGVASVNASHAAANYTTGRHSAAIAWAANDYAYVSAGVVAITDSSVTVPSGLTRLSLGVNEAATGSFLFGHIRRLRYYPRRLDNATLQALTV